MTLTQAKKEYSSAINFIEKGEIKNAFDKLKSMADELQNWSVIDKIDGLETNYKYMIHYFVEGKKDPEQKNVYYHMIRDLYLIADNLLEQIFVRDSSHLFYERKRLANVHQAISTEEYSEMFIKIRDNLSVTELMPEGEDKHNRVRKLQSESESLSKDLFNFIFISGQAVNGQVESLEKLFNTNYVPNTTKSIMVSALTLNILQRFDKRKIELLLNLCNHDEPNIAVRAITGLIPILRQYKNRWNYYPVLSCRTELLSDDALFVRRFMKAILEFIQAHETEKITKKLTEEILPEMMKLSPMIGKKINLEEWMGETGLEDKNPEWQKILKDSGLSNKLEEFSNLQMGGADIFHSTFSNLKSYPFFSEISNWFIPFDMNHSSLQGLFSDKSEADDLLTPMLSTSMMCNSDKYSLCFSIMQMPEQYRKMMISQIGAEGEDLKKMAEEEFTVNPNQKEEGLFKQYIQDLYRFYKLYHRKGDFTDIFASSLDFHKITPVESIITNRQNLQQIALHYFDKNNLDVALEAYIMLSEIDNNNDETWQKIGYCKQMIGDINGALEAYLKAELVDENNSWLLRRIGACYRLIKQPESAIQYYRRLEQLKPDDYNVQINIGHCFLELNQYAEALNYYFKVDFLSSGNTRAWRSIAWCSFLSGKYETAQKYYAQIIDNKPNANDYLNAGHVELCQKNMLEAVEKYSQAVKLLEGFDKFLTMFNEDMSELIKAGISLEYLPLLLDKIRYDSL